MASSPRTIRLAGCGAGSLATALDIATLANGLNKDDANKGNIGVAAVLGVAALDVFCARSLGQNGQARAKLRQPTTPIAAGSPNQPARCGGAARSFEIPADMRTPELMRPLTTG